MLYKRILNIWKNYFTSQFLVTIFIFVLTWAVGGFTGLRFAFLNALTAGICEVIPNFGPFVSGAISAVLAFAFGSSKLELENWQFALIIIGCCILIQLLQNLLISPLIIGKKMDLNPFLVFAGMLLFSVFFGFWGMIFAVPIIASLKETVKYKEEQRSAEPDKVERPLK